MIGMVKIRGVSPIVSILLLIVIVVAAALVSYGFVMGFLGRSTTVATQSIIRVEAVSASSSEVRAYVGNYGPAPVTVDAIYVYTIDGKLVEVAYTSPTRIGTGEVKEVTGRLSGARLLEGEIYYVKVVTKESAVAPSESFRARLSQEVVRRMIMVERVESELETINTFNVTLYIKNVGDVLVTIDEVRVYYSLYDVGANGIDTTRNLLRRINVAREIEPGGREQITVNELPHCIDRKNPCYEIEVVTKEGEVMKIQEVIVAMEMLVIMGSDAGGPSINASIAAKNYGNVSIVVNKIHVYADGYNESIGPYEPVSLGLAVAEYINFSIDVDPNVTYYFEVGRDEKVVTIWRTIVVIETRVVQINESHYNVTVYIRNISPIDVEICSVHVQSSDGRLVVMLSSNNVNMKLKPKEVKEVISDLTLAKGAYSVFVSTEGPWIVEVRKSLEL